MAYTLGIDFGTNSVRALIVDCATGEEIATGVVNYPSGQQGILLDAKDANVARQNPADYLYGLKQSIRLALAAAGEHSGFDNPSGNLSSAHRGHCIWRTHDS